MMVLDQKVPYKGSGNQAREGQDIRDSVNVFTSLLRYSYSGLFRPGSIYQTKIVTVAFEEVRKQACWDIPGYNILLWRLLCLIFWTLIRRPSLLT